MSLPSDDNKRGKIEETNNNHQKKEKKKNRIMIRKSNPFLIGQFYFFLKEKWVKESFIFYFYIYFFQFNLLN
jgi:hypothetical protein